MKKDEKVSDSVIEEREYKKEKLTGIGGIEMRYKLFPSLILAVDKKWCNKGVGQKVLLQLLQRWHRPLF